MKQRQIPDAPNGNPASAAGGEVPLHGWATAIIATRYRVACSPGALIAGAPWLKGKPMVPALTQLAREAGLTFQLLTADQQSINSWRLPVVVALSDGKVGVIEQLRRRGHACASAFLATTHQPAADRDDTRCCPPSATSSPCVRWRR